MPNQSVPFSTPQELSVMLQAPSTLGAAVFNWSKGTLDMDPIEVVALFAYMVLGHADERQNGKSLGMNENNRALYAALARKMKSALELDELVREHISDC